MQKERKKIKKYSIIYADPPWHYSAKKVQGAAENHYPTMSIEELCALPVGGSTNLNIITADAAMQAINDCGLG